MFKFNEEYGNLHIDGTSINIDKINLDELTKYLEKLERRRENVIEQQNEYLSQIIKGVKNECKKNNKRNC